LYSMRYLDPKPCRIPGVGRYWSSGLPTEHPAQIVYLEDGSTRVRLNFAAARCKVHDLVLEDAELPIEESSLGLLILSGSDLVLVDAPNSSYRTVASGVQAIFMNGPGAHFLA